MKPRQKLLKLLKLGTKRAVLAANRGGQQTIGGTPWGTIGDERCPVFGQHSHKSLSFQVQTPKFLTKGEMTMIHKCSQMISRDSQDVFRIVLMISLGYSGRLAGVVGLVGQ